MKSCQSSELPAGARIHRFDFAPRFGRHTVVAQTLFHIRLFCLLAAAFVSASSVAQISPGPLAKAHQSLSGPTGCIRCHAVSAGSPSFHCMECHREIAVRVQQRRGLHATFVPPGASSSTCVKCHSDHNGENFSIVRWDPSPKAFDHGKTGFALQGKHAGLDCRSCHNAKNIAPAERPLLVSNDLGHTYLGLSQACVSCHQDKHQGQLGNNCLQCHNTVDWKSTPTFDHAKTRFSLTGAHSKVDCQKCHTPAANGVVRYTGLQFDRCSSCHADPHRGSFHQKCESCHTTQSWTKTAFITTFDHSKTDFPLLGKHRDVSCNSCHKSEDFKAPIAHQVCADCHTPDPHKGQFLNLSNGGRCESCHTVDGFRPSTFTVADHDRTEYPLRGKHASLRCSQCHVPAGKDTIFRMKFALCTECHKDIHQGQFADAPYFNRCEQCHDNITFSPSTMTIARHQRTDFPLTNSHLAVACIDCHKPMGPGKAVTYHFAGLSCTTCHADPHKGEFALQMAQLNQVGRHVGCQACHSTRTWDDLSAFDHSRTGFALEGTHRAVACIDCHRPPNLEHTLVHVSFRDAPTRCESCHKRSA